MTQANILRASLIAGAIFLAMNDADPARGQQVNVGSGMRGASSGFFENFGVGFGFALNGGPNIVGLNPQGQVNPGGQIIFQQGGAAGVAPGLPGINPGNPATFGFAIQGKEGSLFFNLSAAQGSDRSINSVTPSVTVMNGQGGSFSDVLQRPFVTSLVPVVGNMELPQIPPLPQGSVSPLAQRLARMAAGETAHRDGFTPKPPDAAAPTPEPPTAPPARSSAETGDASVAEIRATLAAAAEAKQNQIDKLAAQAREAETDGKIALARYYYRLAAREATGEQQRSLLARYHALASPGNSPR